MPAEQETRVCLVGMAYTKPGFEGASQKVTEQDKLTQEEGLGLLRPPSVTYRPR